MKKETKKNLKNLLWSLFVFFIILFASLYFQGNELLKKQNNLPNSGQKEKNLTFAKIYPEDLYKMLQVKEEYDFLLLNTDTKPKYVIQKTDSRISYLDVMKEQDALPKNFEEKIVVYSESGKTSQIAAKKLILLGYTNVYNLVGGALRWKEEGFNIIENNQ